MMDLNRPLGPYRIQDRLGAGSMGEVYRAVDPRLGREVAIKVLSGSAVSRESRERFATEVRAVAALAHPNIVSIFDVGDLDGVPFAVMELLEGETLRARIDRGVLPEAEALLFARQILSALEAAHAKQIVHCDLKPENIFATRAGGIKLVDFGIAHMETPGDRDATILNRPGLVSGTIGYMAPEQARGGVADARADLFAFGAVLYEMLTGRRAFSGATTVDVLMAVIAGQPPAFDAAPPVPVWLRAIILKCLRTDAFERYQTARDLASDLERGAAASAISSAAPEPELSSIAVLPFADMSQQRDQGYLCEGIAEELISALSQIAGLKVASRTAAFRLHAAAADGRDAGSRLGVDCVLEGSVRTAGARLRVTTRLTKVDDGYLLWSRQFDRSLDDIFAVQDEMARTIVDTLKPAHAAPAPMMIAPATAETEAYTQYLKGRYYWNRRTEHDLDAAIEHFTRAVEIDPAFGRGHAGLADAAATLALYGLRAPGDVMPLAKLTALKTLALSPDLAEAYVSLALVEAVYEWAWAEAEVHFVQATVLAPRYSTAFQWYAANCLVPLGRFDEARHAAARAAAIDPTSLPISTSAGVIPFYEGRFDEACEALSQTLVLDEGFGPAHYFLGQALVERGDWRAALKHAERAVALSRESPEALAGLGAVAARAGAPERARETLERLHAMAQQRYVSPGLAAQVHAALGDDRAALDALAAARAARAADLAWVAVRPVFRRLHGHAEFLALTRQLGVAKPETA